MPTTITGDPDFSLADALTPNAVVPTPGDLAAAGVVRTALERTLDYVSSLAQDAYDKQIFGVGKLKTTGSTTALKALTGMTEGDLILYLEPSYVGGAAQRLSGFGLFVFYPGVTWPQTLVPGIAGAYLVLTPNDNSGRWVNILAGIGWELGAGSDPVFMPRVAAQSQQWSATGNVNAPFPYTGIGAGYVGTEIVLNTGLPQGATIALDFDFSLNSPSASAGGIDAAIEVSRGGGPWTVVQGSKKPLGGGSSDDVWMPVHLGASFIAPDNDTYDFRVGLSGLTGQTLNLFRTWSARGLSYLPVLPDRPPCLSSTGSFRGSAMPAIWRRPRRSSTRPSPRCASTRSGACSSRSRARPRSRTRSTRSQGTPRTRGARQAFSARCTARA